MATSLWQNHFQNCREIVDIGIEFEESCTSVSIVTSQGNTGIN